MTHTYLLVDALLLKLAGQLMPFPPSDWAIPIYDMEDTRYSPWLIDLENSNRELVDQAIASLQPAVHAAYLDCAAGLDPLLQHLRQLISIVDDKGKYRPLRFADCISIPPVVEVLTDEQRVAFAGPIERWRIHQRDGSSGELVLASTAPPCPLPLRLDAHQIAKIRESNLPDQLIATVLDMREMSINDGTPIELHQWASAAAKMWRAAQGPSKEVLTYCVDGVFATHGRLLSAPTLPGLLAQNDTEDFHLQLAKLRSNYL